MKNPWEFLQAWARENVQATTYDDDATASHLAEACLRAARQAGFKEDAIIRAAHSDLQGFFRSELDSAANKEVERLVSKNKY